MLAASATKSGSLSLPGALRPPSLPVWPGSAQRQKLRSPPPGVSRCEQQPAAQFQARSMLAGSTTASIRDSGNRLKAGFSLRAAAARPGRDSEPVVLSRAPSGKYRETGDEGFPRGEPSDGSTADSCTARTGFRRSVPRFQASLTPRNDDGTHAAYAGLSR
jgi:hypothetical protein